MKSLTGKSGASFVWEDHEASEILTADDFSEEQKMFLKTTVDFVEKEIHPILEDIEAKKDGLSIALLRKAAGIGLCMSDIPETAGGLGLDKTTSLIITEGMSCAGSFAATHGAHVGIGTWPIIFFGTDAQKKKYLPRLATAEMMGAYSLTEAGSGSDALNVATRAVLSDDGQYYLLNGEKVFITNGGWADLYTVFAKVDGEKFTAFLVERGFEGVTVGPEEKKMGIRGSSTCSLFLDNARVPVENVLGEIGRGHVIAFNVLNLGRFKLAAGAVGLGKHMLKVAVRYARDRRQFGKPIAEFGAIKSKIAEMATLIFVEECMTYRTGGNVDALMKGLEATDPDYNEKTIDAIDSFQIECSIAKIHGSEMMGVLADHCLQIHGGYGFIEEYAAARFYRDARINRLYEGTNEINRMLIPGQLLRKTMKGELPLMEKMQEATRFVLDNRPFQAGEDVLGTEAALIRNAKKLFLFTLAQAAQKYMQKIAEEQQVMMWLADVLIEVFACESAMLRAKKIAQAQGEDAAGLAIAMSRSYVNDKVAVIRSAAEQVLVRSVDARSLHDILTKVRNLMDWTPTDTVELNTRIADAVIARGSYTLAP